MYSFQSKSKWFYEMWPKHHTWVVFSLAFDLAAVPTVIFIIFWDFLMFYQIFLSPQEKRFGIIAYTHGIYELPHKLSNDLRFRILGS